MVTVGRCHVAQRKGKEKKKNALGPKLSSCNLCGRTAAFPFRFDHFDRCRGGAFQPYRSNVCALFGSFSAPRRIISSYIASPFCRPVATLCALLLCPFSFPLPAPPPPSPFTRSLLNNGLCPSCPSHLFPPSSFLSLSYPTAPSPHIPPTLPSLPSSHDRYRTYHLH